MGTATRKATLRTFGRYCHPIYEAACIINDQLPVRIDAPKIKVGVTYLHTSHKLVYYRGIFICTICGSHAVTKPRNLAHPCKEHLTQAGRTTMKRLAKGKPPAQYDGWPHGDTDALAYSMRKGSIELFAELARGQSSQKEPNEHLEECT